MHITLISTMCVRLSSPQMPKVGCLRQIKTISSFNSSELANATIVKLCSKILTAIDCSVLDIKPGWKTNGNRESCSLLKAFFRSDSVLNLLGICFCNGIITCSNSDNTF